MLPQYIPICDDTNLSQKLKKFSLTEFVDDCNEYIHLRWLSTITNGSSLSYGQLIHLNQKDVVVATSFYRYGTETIEMVKFCRDHGVSVIAITDVSASPIAAADIKIFLPVAYGTIFDSHCSVYCFFNMMATQICRMNKPEAAELFEKHELVAKRFDVYAEVSRRNLAKAV
jgi:DNA-binding MurR/RpiR family transcriptional regulator